MSLTKLMYLKDIACVGVGRWSKKTLRKEGKQPKNRESYGDRRGQRRPHESKESKDSTESSSASMEDKERLTNCETHI